MDYQMAVWVGAARSEALAGMGWHAKTGRVPVQQNMTNDQ